MAATNIDSHADVGIVFDLTDRGQRKGAELQRSGFGHTSGHWEFFLFRSRVLHDWIKQFYGISMSERKRTQQIFHLATTLD